MGGIISNLKDLSGELLTASKRRRKLGKLFSKAGFLSLGKGAWLGSRGNDAVSGLLIEGSPSDTYVSSFLLPIFDQLKFVSWSLGRRVIHCSVDESVDCESQKAIEHYRTELLPVQSAADIMRYLDTSKIDGFYPLWVKYLCFLRNHELQQAQRYMNGEKVEALHISAAKKFEEIERIVEREDVAGVDGILGQWESASRLIFGDGSYHLDASAR